MKVKVIEERCMGCGSCPSIAPEVFDFNNDGFAYVTVTEVPKEHEEIVKDAINSCPTGAIVEKKSE